MAGAGYKLFSTGEVLTAANVNTYLMQQTVMVFASAAARTTALSGVLAEGMISYRTDSKVLEIYNGTSWVDFSGDITGITTAANSGLSGGATSGNVTLTLAVTAKGDHLIGTGSGTVAVLPIGTTNQTMIVDSTTTTGFKFASSAQSLLTAKGSILAASGANTPAEQTVGTDYAFLQALASATNGIQWNGGAWTTWTPTLGNATKGNGTIDARYIRIGNKVSFFIYFGLGSTSSVSGEVNFTLPFTPKYAMFQSTGWLRDLGVADYIGVPLILTDGKVYTRVLKADGTYGQPQSINSTVPITWGNGDEIYLTGWYEVA